MITKRRKILLAAAVAVLVAAALAWRWRAGSGKAPAMETARVDRGRIVAKVTATGTLSALVTVQVGSQVSGRIAAIDVDFNSPVKKGQVIARIDPQLFDASVEQARANQVAAQGNLAKAKAQALDADRQLERARSLAERKLVAAADLDTAQAGADAARASVQAAEGTVAQARAALHQAEVNLAYTRIVSPTNGVVISRNVDVGQTVAASLQAPTLFVIAEDLAKMQVDTSVAEADVGRLRGGMSASFTVDAFPGDVFRGAVRQVRNAPQTVQNVVTYDAVVDVDNPDQKLKPGMTATVTFVYAEKDDVLRVPNAALRFRPPPGFGGDRKGSAGPRGASGLTGRADAAEPAGPGGEAARGGAEGARAGGEAGPAGGAEAGRRPQGESQGRMVWVVRDERATAVRIRLGISDGTVTEVVSGDLREGDAVVTDVAGAPSAPQGGGFPGGGGRRGPF
jgi:HlyD family secretion protein